jgi:hypothetical protein
MMNPFVASPLDEPHALMCPVSSHAIQRPSQFRLSTPTLPLTS